jgi:WD40 repeat protein
MAATRPDGHIPRGPYLITGGCDGSVRIWRLLRSYKTLLTGDHLLRAALPLAPEAVLPCHDCDVVCLAVSEGLDAGVSAGRDGSCRVFTLSTACMTKSFRHPANAPVLAMVLSCQGDLVMYAPEDGLLHLFDINAHAIASVPAGDGCGGVSTLAVSPDACLLFAGTSAGSIFVYQLASLALLTCILPPANCSGQVDSIAFSPCNNFLLCGFSTGQLCIHTCQVAASLCPLPPPCLPLPPLLSSLSLSLSFSFSLSHFLSHTHSLSEMQ